MSVQHSGSFNTLLKAACLIVGCAANLPAHAAAPATNWPFQGVLFVSSVTGGCVAVGDYSTAIYRPKLSGDTLPGALNIIRARFAGAMIDLSTRGQFRGSGNYDYAQTSTRGGFFTVPSAGRYLNFVVKPATITASTEVVTLAGEITNFLGDTGCTVGVKGTFGKRVDP